MSDPIPDKDRAATDSPPASAGGAEPERVSDDGRALRTVLDDDAIQRALFRVANEILERDEAEGPLYLVAVPKGGVPLGRRLAERIAELRGEPPLFGVLDTTLYRDDLTTRGSRPQLRRTEMPERVDDAVVILVEDVVNTGRTIRAAMDALMDFGRPRVIQVMALVDRGHRELPIKIDYVGKNIPTQADERVTLRELGDALEVVVEGGEGEAG